MIEKTANQLWKESRTTLSFKDWITREKEKYSNYGGDEEKIISNKPLQDTLQKGIADMRARSGYKTDISKNKTFGIPNILIIGVGVAVLGYVGYRFYKNYKG